MKKVLLLTLAVISSSGMIAMQPQQPQYNQEATNKLKNMLNKLVHHRRLNSAEVQQLILAGANPNVLADSGIYAGNTVLLLSLPYSYNANLVSFLLQHHADPNVPSSANDTPLQIAARYGYYDQAMQLIAYGANVHTKDNFGKTALIPAIENNHPKIVRLLLENDATNNDIAINDMVLALARQRGNQEIVTLLATYTTKQKMR